MFSNHRLSMRTVFLIPIFLQLFCIIPSVVGHATERVSEIEEEELETRDVVVEVNGNRVQTTLINGVHASPITIHVYFKNTKYVVSLALNTYLLSSTYVERLITKDGPVYKQVNQAEEMCYYIGEVQGKNHSSAAFSTCDGIKGFFVLNDTTFHVKPVNVDDGSLEGLYQIRKVTNDNLSRWVCGTKDIERQLNESDVISQRVKRQIVSGSMSGKLIIELYVANDYLRYTNFMNNGGLVARSTKEIVNVANLLYQPVGLFMVLVGIETWQVDQFEVSTDSAVTLSNWHRYRVANVAEKQNFDVGFLISGQTFLQNVLGLASVATMCSTRSSGGIIKAINDNSPVSGAILAHEVGHNFGLSHDSKDCFCESPYVACIMAAQASTYRPSLYFSSCSKAQLKSSIDKGFDVCLKDMPVDLSQYYVTCGNGILEVGEECDCGRVPSQECNSSCCNTTTCKLIGSAKCASGGCCNLSSCQLRNPGYECRGAVGVCDLPEYCEGQSAFCPTDVFKHDGFNCSAELASAYCWTGLCQNQRTRCKEIFGSGSTESDRVCYSRWNIMGNLNGNCGVRVGATEIYTKCNAEDVMCGAIQCASASNVVYRYVNFLYRTSKSAMFSNCHGIVVDYGKEIENPGLVPSGSPCETGKMCVSQKCVSVESVLDQNPCPECVHGICNNKGRCHCEVGYGGPSCDKKGSGGSTDSGPVDNTPTTRSGHSNGMIAGIVIGILLLILIIILILCDFIYTGYIKNVGKLISNKFSSGPSLKYPSSVPRTRSMGHENTAYNHDNPSVSVLTTRPAPIAPMPSYEYSNNINGSNFNHLDPSNLYNGLVYTKKPNLPPPPIPTQHLSRAKASPSPPYKPPPVSAKPSSTKPQLPSKPASKPLPPPQNLKPGSHPVDLHTGESLTNVRNLKARFEN